MEAGTSDAYIVSAQIGRPVSVNKIFFKCVCVCACVCVRASPARARACVRACIRVRACVCVRGCMPVCV